ncbi:MAG: enoyl-CoA hydratase/isomerase family protein [Sphingomonadaceae bacterium]
MGFETVIYEKRGHLALVTLNRPQARNAYDDQMQGELDQVWRDVRGDANVWVVVLTGTGEAFCAGRDVKELAAYQAQGRLVPRYDPASPTYGQFGAHLHRYGIRKPVVAGINGFAVGGGLALALSCDIRVMAETAWIGDLHVNIGQVGGALRYVQALPYPIAAELVFMGGRMSAQRAYEVGLVNRVVPREEVLPEAIRIAERICEMSPLAVQRSKEIMQMYLQPEAGLAQLEEHYMAEMRLTEDGQEGPRAFREKRKPVWKGC